MELNLAILQIALVFLPGIVWAAIDAKFASKMGFTNAHFVMRAFLFGLAAYTPVLAGYQIFGETHPVVSSILDNTVEPFALIKWYDIAYSTAAAVVFSIFWVYGANYKVLTRFFQFIGATNRYGDEDVWDFILNSPDPEVEYAHVRDFENELIFCGWISVFSETGKLREFVLRDVEVYDFDNNKLYEQPLIYLARAEIGMTVEFPARPEDIVSPSIGSPGDKEKTR